MKTRRLISMLATLLLCAVVAKAAEDLQVRWSELGPLITGEEISLVLPAGVRVQGMVVAVTPEALDLLIKKTSDRRAYPKMQTAIPRSSISAIELRKMRRQMGRVIGTIGGFWWGYLLGSELASWSKGERAMRGSVGPG